MGNVWADVKPDYSQYLAEKKDCLICGGKDFRLWAKSSWHLYAIRLEEETDYTSNSLKRSYPHGLGVEVFSFDVLEKAYKSAQKDYEKEHVTPYIYRNPPLFKIIQVEAPKKLCAPDRLLNGI